jgi:hypothetical protein
VALHHTAQAGGMMFFQLDTCLLFTISHTADMDSCHTLQTLKLSALPKLEAISSLAALRALQTLEITFFGTLEHWPSLDTLTLMQTLQLHCSLLQEIPPLVPLTALQTLDLSDCSSLKRTKSLSTLTALHDLDLANCRQLQLVQTIWVASYGQLHMVSAVSVSRLDFLGHAQVYPSNGCGESAPGVSAKMLLYRTLGILVCEHFSAGWFVRLLTLKAPIETGDTAVWMLIFVRELAALMAASFRRGGMCQFNELKWHIGESGAELLVMFLNPIRGIPFLVLLLAVIAPVVRQTQFACSFP